MARRTIGVLSLVLVGLTPGVARAQTEQVYYYHTDAVGSVRMITGANGQEVVRYEYLPFGQVWGTPALDPRMFAGQEHDAESQTDYVRARYYQGQTGRFTSVDPAHVNGDPFDSQSWNAYAFGRNNPLKFSDPTGTDYLISAYGGTPFWFDQGVGDFRSLKRYLTAQGFQTLGDDESGVILNEAGEVVADYSYTSRSARMFGDAGQMSSAWLKAGITEMGKNALFSAGLGALRWGLEAGAAYLEAAEIANAARVGAATEHAAGRLLLRGISPGDVNTAIKTAKIAGQVTTQAGKYSTLQKVYIGTNGITVIVEQAGRNAGKVITAFPTGLP